MTVQSESDEFTASQPIEGVIAATIVWGEAFITTFLDLCLPCLLSPNNLPRMAALAQSEYRIYTSDADMELISSSSVYAELCQLVPTRLLSFGDEDLSDPVAAQYRILLKVLAEGRETRRAVLYCMPDAIWSDGSIGHMTESFVQGSHAVMPPTIRVVQETIESEIRERHAGEQVISLTTDEVLELAGRHMHPLTAIYARNSERFPYHAELFLWLVENEGFVMSYTIRDPKAFVPHLAKLSSQLLIANDGEFDKVDAVTDVSRMICLSLTPLLQDRVWYARRSGVEIAGIARWWLIFDSAFNDVTIRQPIRLPVSGRGVTESKWRRAEHACRFFAITLVAAREIVATIFKLNEMGFSLSARVLAAALHTARVYRCVAVRGAVSILLPTDAALNAYGSLDWLLEPGQESRLRGLVADHVILGELADNREVVTASGRRIFVRRGRGRFILRDVVAEAAPIEHRGRKIHSLRGVLFPERLDRENEAHSTSSRDQKSSPELLESH